MMNDATFKYGPFLGSDRFYPKIPNQWDLNHVTRANNLSRSLSNFATVFKVIALGSFFIVCDNIRVRGFKAVMNSWPSVVPMALIGVIFLILGVYSNAVAARHKKGLTDEQALAIQLKECKERLEKLPISKEDLKEGEEFGPWTSIHACRDLPLYPLYWPSEGKTPRFKVTAYLTRDQRQELLDVASPRGIQLEFWSEPNWFTRRFSNLSDVFT